MNAHPFPRSTPDKVGALITFGARVRFEGEPRRLYRVCEIEQTATGMIVGGNVCEGSGYGSHQFFRPDRLTVVTPGLPVETP